jgi:hypothetical protein
MSELLSKGGITQAQKNRIERCVAAGDDFEAIYIRVRELGHASKEELRDEVDGQRQVIELRRQFKREGVRLMRDFMNRVRTGSDVDDMAAMLELAIYRDLLRRYTENEKALEEVKLEALLRIDIQYRRVRIASQAQLLNGKGADAAKKLTARMLPKIVARLVSLADEKTATAIKALVPETVEWAKGELGRENIEEMEKDEHGIEQLNALYAQDCPGAGNQAEAGHENAHGLAR